MSIRDQKQNPTFLIQLLFQRKDASDKNPPAICFLVKLKTSIYITVKELLNESSWAIVKACHCEKKGNKKG